MPEGRAVAAATATTDGGVVFAVSGRRRGGCHRRGHRDRRRCRRCSTTGTPSSSTRPAHPSRTAVGRECALAPPVDRTRRDRRLDRGVRLRRPVRDRRLPAHLVPAAGPVARPAPAVRDHRDHHRSRRRAPQSVRLDAGRPDPHQRPDLGVPRPPGDARGAALRPRRRCPPGRRDAPDRRLPGARRPRPPGGPRRAGGAAVGPHRRARRAPAAGAAPRRRDPARGRPPARLAHRRTAPRGAPHLGRPARADVRGGTGARRRSRRGDGGPRLRRRPRDGDARARADGARAGAHGGRRGHGRRRHLDDLRRRRLPLVPDARHVVDRRADGRRAASALLGIAAAVLVGRRR